MARLCQSMTVDNKKVEHMIEEELRDLLSDYRVDPEIVSVDVKEDPMRPNKMGVEVRIGHKHVKTTVGVSHAHTNSTELLSEVGGRKIAESYASHVGRKMPTQSELLFPLVDVRDYENDIVISCPFCSEKLRLSDYRSTDQHCHVSEWGESVSDAAPYTMSSTVSISELNDRERIIARLYMLGKFEKHLRFNCSGETASVLETFL